MHYDFVVVGSGPGGATTARQLARAGARVAILERGRDWRENPLYGTYAGALAYADRRDSVSAIRIGFSPPSISPVTPQLTRIVFASTSFTSSSL